MKRLAVPAMLAYALACRSPSPPSPALPESGPTTDATPAASAPAPPEPAPDAGAESPLHVVAEGWRGSAEMNSQFHLCPLDGAVFACGGTVPVVLRDEGFVRDASLAAGLPGDRFIATMVGRWPDATWLVYEDPDMGQSRFGVYRWSGTRWVLARDVPRGSAGLSVQVVAWREGAFLRVIDSFNAGRYAMVRLGGTGPMPSSAPSPPGTDRKGCIRGVPGLIPEVQLVATADGDLYGAGSTCPMSSDAVLERWTRQAIPEVLRIPTHGCGYSSILRPLAAGIAALGDCGSFDDITPFVTVFDGHTWAEIDVPRMRGHAIGYARDDGGEWLVVRTPGLGAVASKNQLFRRLPGASWQPVALPPSPHVEPWSVETVGADTWVSGSTAPDDELLGNVAVVLRTRPVEHVFHER